MEMKRKGPGRLKEIYEPRRTVPGIRGKKNKDKNKKEQQRPASMDKNVFLPCFSPVLSGSFDRKFRQACASERGKSETPT